MTHSHQEIKQSNQDSAETYIVADLAYPCPRLRRDYLPTKYDKLFSNLIELKIEKNGHIKCFYKPDKNKPHRFIESKDQSPEYKFKSIQDAEKSLHQPYISGSVSEYLDNYDVIFKVNENFEIQSIYALCLTDFERQEGMFAIRLIPIFSALKQFYLTDLYLEDVKSINDLDEINRVFNQNMIKKLFPFVNKWCFEIDSKVTIKNKLSLLSEMASIQALDKLGNKQINKNTSHLIERYLASMQNLKIVRVALLEHKINFYKKQLENEVNIPLFGNKTQKKEAANALIQCLKTDGVNFSAIDKKHNKAFMDGRLKDLFQEAQNHLYRITKALKKSECGENSQTEHQKAALSLQGKQA